MDEATINQGVPIRGTGPIIINLVLDDIKEYPDTLKSDFIRRASQGELKYGYPLQSNNGRDSLADLYQEILDAVLYSKQRLGENFVTKAEQIVIQQTYNTCLDICNTVHKMIQERKEKK